MVGVSLVSWAERGPIFFVAPSAKDGSNFILGPDQLLFYRVTFWIKSSWPFPYYLSALATTPCHSGRNAHFVTHKKNLQKWRQNSNKSTFWASPNICIKYGFYNEPIIGNVTHCACVAAAVVHLSSWRARCAPVQIRIDNLAALPRDLMATWKMNEVKIECPDLGNMKKYQTWPK